MVSQRLVAQTLLSGLCVLGCVPELIEGTNSSTAGLTTTSTTEASTSEATTSTTPTSSSATATTTGATTSAATTAAMTTTTATTDATSTGPATSTMADTTTSSTTSCSGPCEPGEPLCTDACEFDFSMVPQWYCTGTCSPVGKQIGVQSCDQADADLYCQLLKGDPSATASEWKQASVIAEPGFCCLELDEKTLDLGPLPEFGIDALCYQETDMLENHGLGYAILREELTCD